MTTLSLCSVVGARPQFIKLAPICRAVEAINALNERLKIDHTIIHSGQHYDADLSDAQWGALELPSADIKLGIGSGPHGGQTGRMLIGLEEAFKRNRTDCVLVYGDTNTTLAASLAAAKLGIATAHVEAGLRSDDRRMPEEINRLVADHVCELLLAPTRYAVERLTKESLGDRTVWTGDVMLDAVQIFKRLAPAPDVLAEDIRPRTDTYVLATVHRAENTGPQVLARLLQAMDRIARDVEVLFPMHPRTRVVVGAEFDDWLGKTPVTVVRPVSYLEMLGLTRSAAVVMTDSGGLQKEAMFLGTPCVTLRDRTEWPETVTLGANRIAGTDAASVVEAVKEARMGSRNGAWADDARREYGGGESAERIVQTVIEYITDHASAA